MFQGVSNSLALPKKRILFLFLCFTGDDYTTDPFDHRIVLERPEYGYATYFFELVASLPIDWQIKRLVIVMKLTSCSRITLIENKALLVIILMATLSMISVIVVGTMYYMLN